MGKLIQSDRGDGPVGIIIGSGVFLFGLILVVYFALAYHGQQILAGATQEGAVYGARLDGDQSDGEALADRMIAETAGSLFEGPVATSTRVRTGADGQRWLEITASGQIRGPIGSMRVEATGSAPLEEFRPQPGG